MLDYLLIRRANVLVSAVLVGVIAPAGYAFEVNPNNTVPGVVANSLIARGNGADWQTGEILMILTQGTVYNDPNFDSQLPQPNFWNAFPDLEFDSWVGIPGDTTTSILGGAGDLGDPGPAVIAGQKVSVTWFNTDQTNTGTSRIANISLTDDARGTFTVIAGFSPNTLLQESGWVINGVAYFDIPGDLNQDGFVGVSDLNLVLGSWNQAVPPAPNAADPSKDGFVGIEDLNKVLGFWNEGTPPPASVVPEPASIFALLLGTPFVLRRLRDQGF